MDRLVDRRLRFLNDLLDHRVAAPDDQNEASGVSIASEISRSSKSAPHLPVRERM
jgi:hypothetical protein